MRPQLFFNCTLCPTEAKESLYTLYSASHKEVSLVYFSTFEPIDQTPDSIMQQAGVPMLYDSASNPRLFIYPVENVLGLAPHSVFHRWQQSPHESTSLQGRSSPWKRLRRHTDTQRDRGNGIRLYEVNIWMWRYGRGYPRMVSIAEAERIRRERISESRARAEETRKRRSEAAAAAGAAKGGGGPGAQ
jgi:hypothetical protein